MSGELFPRPALPHRRPEETVHHDPILGEQTEHSRWETRAAQWRARELAERVFGGEVEARLTGRVGGGPFRGLLHLDVPFRDLSRHRALERVFLASAATDPVLSQIALVFVLSPRGSADGAR